MAADDLHAHPGTPSAQQLAAFDGWRGKHKSVALVYQYDGADRSAALRAIAAHHGGRMVYAARVEQLVIGPSPAGEQACIIEFSTRAAARACVTGAEHAAWASRTAGVLVRCISPHPRALAVISAVLARVLPLWPFDNSVEPGEEPGVGTSTVMPSRETLAAFRTHPLQEQTLAMINWLKFRDRAAYMRYGKIAIQTTHSIGAKLVYASRYQQVLLGNGGDPALKQWDEFALMQYPGRACFAYMGSLRRYRRGLADRAAGLAEHGQNLALSIPAEEFTWRP